MWRPTKNQLHLPSVPFLGSLFLLGSFWFVSLSSKKQQRRPQTTHPHEKCSLTRASRSLGSRLNGLVFSLFTLGFMGCFCGSEARLIPAYCLLFGCLVFGFPFSCLNHLPLKDPLGRWLEVMMANNAKKGKEEEEERRKTRKKKKSCSQTAPIAHP